jgi:hypothetical protein
LTILARAVFPWRVLLLAAILCASVGGVIAQRLDGTRSVSRALPASSSPQKSLAALPLAAQGPISTAVGADRAAFQVSPLGAGTYAAHNAQQNLSARFLRSGVTVSSHGLRASLRLRSIAYGDSVRPIAPVRPSANGNRVTYEHPGVSEWYANGPLGLEQGFTVGASAPASVGALTLTLDLSTNASASASRDGRSLQLTRASGTLRYDGLLVTDASGRRLSSGLELSGNSLLIHVATSGARFPLRIDPLIQQGNKLVPSDETGPGSEAGTSVALSADGNTALIGGIGDEPHGKPMEGAAWVFTRSGSTWTQQGPKLTGGGEQGEGQFGISAVLSADGNTALIGGINDETGGKQVGAAWVFTRSGSTWTQQGPKLTGGAEEGTNGRFGKSVALSGDGNTALVGAYFDENVKKEPQGGSAFVFTRSGATWKHQGAKLAGNDEGGTAEFGISVALSTDGNTALVGGPNDEGKAKLAMSGAAWVFTRSGSTWAQQGAKLTGTGESGPGELGWSVALSADGNTALAGAPADGDGAAFAFARTGSTWTQQGSKLIPSDATPGSRLRLGRGALGRRHARADRRTGRQRLGRPHGGGVGIRANRLDLGAAAREDPWLGRGSRKRIRRSRGALGRRRHCAARGADRRLEHRRGMGLRPPSDGSDHRIAVERWLQHGHAERLCHPRRICHRALRIRHFERLRQLDRASSRRTAVPRGSDRSVALGRPVAVGERGRSVTKYDLPLPPRRAKLGGHERGA